MTTSPPFPPSTPSTPTPVASPPRLTGAELACFSSVLYHPTLGFAILAIPKIGCSSVKKQLAAILRLDTSPYPDIHIAAAYLLSILRFDHSSRLILQNRPTITFVRDPRHRLRSGFIEKLTRPEPFTPLDPAYQLITDWARMRGVEPDLDRGVTFREFLNYICDKPALELNDHWRPESEFVSALPVPPRMVIRLEHLEAALEVIAAAHDIVLPPAENTNATLKIAGEWISDMPLADVPSGRIRELRINPTTEELFSSDLDYLLRSRLPEAHAHWASAPSTLDVAQLEQLVQDSKGANPFG